MDPVGDVGNRRAGLERERLGLGDAVRPEPDADQAGQLPDRVADRVERGLVEDRHGHDLELRQGTRESLDRTREGLVGAGRGDDRRLLDPGRRHLGADDGDVARVAVGPGAVDDRVGQPEDPEERPSAAAILGRALDEARDLDELDEDAADPGQGRHRAKGREGVVARLDLDLGQGLEERRFADVRRPDERDLGGAFAPNGDRITVDRAGADAGVLDLGQERLAEVGVRPVPVVRKLRQEGPDLADPVAPLLADQPALDDLGERPMRHRHGRSPSRTTGSAGERGHAQHTIGCDERHASVPAPSIDAGAGRGGSAVPVGDRGVPGVGPTPAAWSGHGRQGTTAAAAGARPIAVARGQTSDVATPSTTAGSSVA